MLRLAIGIALVCACSGGAERPNERGPVSTTPKSEPNALGEDAAPATASDNETPMSEIEARALLSERFRNAGFRVVHDVLVTKDGYQITADGYDPDRGVGFEYIAESERGTDVSAEERSALGGRGQPILILDAAGQQRVSKAVDSFLGALPDAGPR